MRRVVVTGMGVISPIGNSVAEVALALREGRSGIEHSPEMAEHGFRSQVAGTLKIDPSEHMTTAGRHQKEGGRGSCRIHRQGSQRGPPVAGHRHVDA